MTLCAILIKKNLQMKRLTQIYQHLLVNPILKIKSESGEAKSNAVKSKSKSESDYSGESKKSRNQRFYHYLMRIEMT